MSRRATPSRTSRSAGGRTRRTGIRGRSRRGSGRIRSGLRRRAAPPPADAAARAVSACPAGGAGGAAPVPRSRGNGSRTAPRTRPARRPGLRPPRGRGTAAPRRRRALRPPPACGSRCRRPTRSSDLHAEALLEARFERERPRRWTRPPNGVSRHSRQSPSSSRKRSTTIRRSVGSEPVTSRSSSRYISRLSAARSSRSCASRSRAAAARRPVSPRRGPLELADERPERASKFDRPADGVAVPERQLAGHAGRRADRHAVVADLLDPPELAPSVMTSPTRLS